MTNPRVEELPSDEDSDPEEMDISSLAPRTSPSQNGSLMNPASIPSSIPPSNAQSNQTMSKERVQHWSCLYPLYFDASRTRSEGRRVGKDLAVQNPLARDIVEAVAGMSLQVAFEPAKTHPKDWANPGRVRVYVKDEESGSVRRNMGGVEGKQHLYLKVAEHLRAHPTTKESPLKLRVPGLPTPEEAPAPPAIPRGWKMGTVLPLHSAAASGGGVSENMFKDMMAEMQGGEREQSPAGGKKKKEKKIKG